MARSGRSASMPLIDRVVVEGFACTSAARTLVDSAPASLA